MDWSEIVWQAVIAFTSAGAGVVAGHRLSERGAREERRLAALIELHRMFFENEIPYNGGQLAHTPALSDRLTLLAAQSHDRGTLNHCRRIFMMIALVHDHHPPRELPPVHAPVWEKVSDEIRGLQLHVRKTVQKHMAADYRPSRLEQTQLRIRNAASTLRARRPLRRNASSPLPNDSDITRDAK